MLLSAVSVLVVAQSISEIPEGLMNNPVLKMHEHTNVMTLLMLGLYVDVCQSFLCEHSHHTNAMHIDTTAPFLSWRVNKLYKKAL